MRYILYGHILLHSRGPPVQSNSVVTITVITYSNFYRKNSKGFCRIISGKSQDRQQHPVRKIVDSLFMLETEKSSPNPQSPKKVDACPSHFTVGS